LIRVNALSYKLMDNFTDNNTQKVKDGFEGQRLVVLPNGIVKNLQVNPFTKQLYFTHIGFFPTAKNHFVERYSGSKNYILIYCVKGIGWYKTSGHKEIIRAGDFFLLPPNIYHNYGSDRNDAWSIYFLHFNGLLAAPFFDRLGKKNKTQISFYKERNKMFDHMYRIIDTGYSRHNLEHVNLNLWQLLNTFMYDKYFEDLSTHYITEPAIHNAAVKTTINYMQNHLDKKISLNELSQVANLSISRFSNVFKEATGYSPNDYFLRLKIQKACQYLDLTNKRVKAISYLIGIEDQYYFSRLFKKIMGKSPVEYRKSQK